MGLITLFDVWEALGAIGCHQEPINNPNSKMSEIGQMTSQGRSTLIGLMEVLALKDTCLCAQMYNGPKRTKPHLIGVENIWGSLEVIEYQKVKSAKNFVRKVVMLILLAKE